jgi:hypothetical protein
VFLKRKHELWTKALETFLKIFKPEAFCCSKEMVEVVRSFHNENSTAGVRRDRERVRFIKRIVSRYFAVPSLIYLERYRVGSGLFFLLIFSN